MSPKNQNSKTTRQANPTLVLLVMVVTSFLISFAQSSVNLAIPIIGIEFGVSTSMLGWISMGTLIPSLAFSVPVARIADLTGRKRIFVIGMIGYCVFSLGTALATSFFHIIICRLMLGLSLAFMFSTSIAILISAFPAEKRGRVLGFNTASLYIGLSIGPVIGGFLTHNFGWRSSFILALISGAVIGGFAIYGLENDKKRQDNEEKRALDIPGMILFIIGSGSLAYGISSIARGILPKILVIAGIIVLIIFVRVELKSNSPLLDIKLFKTNKTLWYSSLAALFEFGSTASVVYMLSIYLQVVRNFDPQTSGLILLFQPIVIAIVSPIAGRLSDTKSPFKIATGGLCISFCSLICFSLLGVDSPILLIILALILIGTGSGSFSTPNQNAIMSSVSPSEYSVASSLVLTMRSFGSVLGMSIITIVTYVMLESYTLADAPPEMISKAFKYCYIAFIGFCILGLVFARERKDKSKK